MCLLKFLNMWIYTHEIITKKSLSSDLMAFKIIWHKFYHISDLQFCGGGGLPERERECLCIYLPDEETEAQRSPRSHGCQK